MDVQGSPSSDRHILPQFHLSLLSPRLVSSVEAAETPRPCMSLPLPRLPLFISSFSSDNPLASFISSFMPWSSLPQGLCTCFSLPKMLFHHPFHLVYTQSSFIL